MSVISELVVKLVTDSSGLVTGLTAANSQIKTTSENFTSMGKALEGHSKSLEGGIKSIVSTGATLIAGLGATVAGLGALFTSSASEMESYQSKLMQLYGDEQLVAEKLKTIMELAANTPFDDDQFIQASLVLKKFGVDSEETLKIVGEAAAGTGQSVVAASTDLTMAMMGVFRGLRQYGITEIEVTKENYKQMGLEVTAIGQEVLRTIDKNGQERFILIDKTNKDIIQSTVLSIWNDKYSGAMERQSKTFSGLVINIKKSMEDAGKSIMGFDATIGAFKPDSLFIKVKDVTSQILSHLNGIDWNSIGVTITGWVTIAIDVISQFWTNIQPGINAMRQALSDSAVIVAEFFKSFDEKTVLTGLAELLNDVAIAIGGVIGWLKDNPEIVKIIAAIGTGLAAWALVISPLTTLAVTIGGVVTAIVEGGGLIGAAVTALGGPIGVAVVAIGALFVAWKTNMFGIRDITVQIWAQIEPSIITPMTNIQNAVMIAWQNIGANIKIFWEQAQPILTQFITVIISNLPAAFEFLKTITQSVFDIITKLWQDLGPIVTDAVTIITVVVGAALVLMYESTNKAITDMLAAWNAVAPVLLPILTIIKDTIVLVWDLIIAVIQAAMRIIKDVVTLNWLDIGKATDEMGSKIWESIKDYFGKVATSISEIMTAIWNKIVEIWTGIWNYLFGGSIIPDIYNAFVEWFTKIRDGITQTWNTIKTTTETTWSSIQSSLTSIWNEIKATAETVWTTMKDAIIATWTALRNSVAGAWVAVQSALQGAWDTIKSAAQTTWTAIQNVFTSISISGASVAGAWSGIGSSLSSTWNSWISAAQSAYSKLQSIWASMSSGGPSTSGGGGGGSYGSGLATVTVQYSNTANGIQYSGSIDNAPAGKSGTVGGTVSSVDEMIASIGQYYGSVAVIGNGVQLAAKGFEGWVNRPTPFIMGEGGEPEYVSITPRSKMNGGSGSITININAPVFGVDDLDRKIESAIQEIRRNVRSLGG